MKFKINFTLPELSAKKIVRWDFRLDNHDKVR